MLKVITRKTDDVIVAISNTAEIVPNGILCDGYIVGMPTDVAPIYEIHTVDVPAHVKQQKYCYTALEGFYTNTDYAEPPLDDDQLRVKVAQQEQEIAQITYALMMGGLI